MREKIVISVITCLVVLIFCCLTIILDKYVKEQHDKQAKAAADSSITATNINTSKIKP